ncbi:MAG: sugar transferase, partial [Pseudomonadota bacterium]
MVIQYAVALAVVATGAAVTTALIWPRTHPLRDSGSLLRESYDSGAGDDPGGGSPSGALDTNSIVDSEFAAAFAARKTPASALMKRLLDIVLSAALLVFLAPLLLLTAIAIKLDSSGPLLYRQRRLGLGAREFSVFKFRSMVINAEQNGPQYAATGDERVTRIGRIIRRFRIDEIPQAINVLRGEMSFVGPRPERPEFVTELAREIPHYHCRHLMKPGITGWAQV